MDDETRGRRYADYLPSARPKREWFPFLRREWGWTSYGPPGRWLRFQMRVHRAIYGRRR